MHLATAAERRAVVPFVADLEVHAGQVAVVAGGEQVDYGDLAGLVRAAATRLGVERKLVAVTVGNGLEPLVWYLAALHGGHCVLPLPAVDGGGLASLAAGYDPDVVIGPGPAGWDVDVRRERSVHDLHPDLALLLSTSGSTGSPRLVRLSHENVQANARSISRYLELRPGDRAITSLPAHYCYGLSVIHTHLLTGAGLVLTDASVVDPCFWRAFQEGGATSLAGVPHTFDLLDRVGFDAMDLPTLRYVTQAGGRLAPATVQRYAALGARDGWRLFVMYGQTEATARMAYLPPELAASNPTSIGVPIEGGSFEIEPVEGFGDGAGELVYRGPNVMLGYAEGAADLALGATVAALRTGDIGRRTDDGLYEVLARRSRFVKLFGLRIDLGRVEQLLEDDGIRALCTGDDTRLVVGVVGDHGIDVLRRRLAEVLGLPLGCVAMVRLDDLPLLASGKPDHAAVQALADRAGPADPVATPAHLADPRADLAAILGVASLDDDDTFVSAGGDSLSYVEASIELEAHLGTLPADWHVTPFGTLLAAGRPRPRRGPARLEVGVVLRALAILLVVGNHADLVDISGSAHVLLAVAGCNFARFQRASGHLWRSIARIAVPSMVWIATAVAVTDDFDVTHALLLRGWLGAGHERWGYWFVESLVQLLLIVGLLLAVPVVRRIEQRHAFRFALAVTTLGLALRFDALGLPEQSHLIFRPHGLLWIFGIGWLGALATSTPHRLLVSGLVLLATPGFFADPARGLLLGAGLLTLTWVRTVPVGARLVRPIGTLADASLHLYLVHWQVLPLVDTLPRPVAVGACVLAGLAAARVVRRLPRAWDQMVTRMRWLAKAPMPMWRPSISTVVVPSGDAAVIVPTRPGTTSASSRNSRSPGANSSSSGMRVTVKPPPTVTSLSGRISGAT